ncbi:M57 family metalloprotease [Streptococcus cuniculipharyngis]|uniref:Matrixin family metalloprotease n=1 Tax=Streptococcus cuniculipharyngis TaxID=1562651 RepID=A0A5C5SEA8_9STRE|nr:M57 family metalloprotease [Streptococcus cuniculipharyngis]TWS99194.1 matrixin family metalloprotease [Streptococcus cuniculipharyngis]
MFSLLRLLLVIPRFLGRLLWNVIWSFVQLVMVIFLLWWGMTWYVNNSTSELANQLSNLMSNVSLFFRLDKGNLNESLQNLATDFYANQEGTRWSSNQAKVYITSSQPELVSAYQTALANWNATGVFTFQLVETPEQADIVAGDAAEVNSQAAGLAETKMNSLTNRIVAAKVTLNTYYLLNSDYGYDFERLVNTAEHELGHAIGLAHNDTDVSVMQSSGSYYGIQEVDVTKVRELYAQ